MGHMSSLPVARKLAEAVHSFVDLALAASQTLAASQPFAVNQDFALNQSCI